MFAIAVVEAADAKGEGSIAAGAVGIVFAVIVIFAQGTAAGSPLAGGLCAFAVALPLGAIGAVASEFFAVFAGAIADAPFGDTAGAFDTKAFSGHPIGAEAGGELDIADLAGGAAAIAGGPCFVIAAGAGTLSAVGADTGFFFADFIALIADDAALFAIGPCAATADFDAILSIAALAGEGIEFAASAGDTSTCGEALSVSVAGA